MSPRIAWCFVLGLILGNGTVGIAELHEPAVPRTDASGVEVAGLRDQLAAGLRARLPSEFTFIAIVVDKVESNELPLDLVISTFQWARRKQPYPFPYFEHALRLRAASRGIRL
jgi:hypothetical protein